MNNFFESKGWEKLTLRQRVDRRGRKRGSSKADRVARKWDLDKVNACANRFNRASEGELPGYAVKGPTVADRLADDPRWREQQAARAKANPNSVVAQMAEAVVIRATMPHTRGDLFAEGSRFNDQLPKAKVPEERNEIKELCFRERARRNFNMGWHWKNYLPLVSGAATFLTKGAKGQTLDGETSLTAGAQFNSWHFLTFSH
jgi:hypothetical protein